MQTLLLSLHETYHIFFAQNQKFDSVKSSNVTEVFKMPVIMWIHTCDHH